MADETFTKADLDAAIEKAVGPLKESVTNLESKRDELIAENRRLKRGAEVKPEDLQAAEERADKAEARVKELEKATKDATVKAEKAEKALIDEQGFTQKLLKQDGLKSALIANGVKDEDFIDSLTAKFEKDVQIVSEGDNRIAKVGDKPLADHIKEWAASDAGKKFVAAAVNSGGGAAGGGGKKAAGKTMTRSAYNALSQEEKSALGPDMVKGELTLVDDAA